MKLVVRAMDSEWSREFVDVSSGLFSADSKRFVVQRGIPCFFTC